MKYTLVLLLWFAVACTPKEVPSEARKETASKASPTLLVTANSNAKKSLKLDSTKTVDKELQKILRWFEQMDAIYRESLWVLRQSKAPVGKSPFGKMQRALLIEMKQKLSNKSLFKCDVYSMKRVVVGVEGVPQNAEVFQRCHSKEAFVPIGEWSHPLPLELTIEFQGGNLSEVLGLATAILSPRIRCKLKSSEGGLIDNFTCENLMVDYHRDKNQVLRFKTFEYTRSAKSLLRLQAEVLENLDPVRKIEVNVPMDGKIKVVETVLQAPMFEATQVPANSSPSSGSLPMPQKNGRPRPIGPVQQDPPIETPNAIENQELTHEQNHQNQQNQQQKNRGRQERFPPQSPPPPVPVREENGQEGFQDGFGADSEGLQQPAQEGGSGPQIPIPAEPIPAPEIPRELNTQ